MIPEIPCLLVIKAKLDSTGLYCPQGSKTKKDWTALEHACGLRQWLIQRTWLLASQHRDKKINMRSKTLSHRPETIETVNLTSG